MELGKIYQENCIETLSRLSDDAIDRTITSPPYDDLRDYKGYQFPGGEIAELLCKRRYRAAW